MPAIKFKKGRNLTMNETFMTALQDETNKSVTENGAIGYNTTYNELLDFNYKVPSLRNASDEVLQREVTLLISSIVDPELLLRYMFFLRDARGGMGERRIFRAMLKELAFREAPCVPRMLPLIVEYGRWDDLFVLKDTPFQKEMEGYIIGTLEADKFAMNKNTPCSLLAKWMPSINASSPETIKLATYFAQEVFHITPAKYRKELSALRKHLKVVEAQISRGEFSEIDYERVPSLANLRYSKLFLSKDEKRRTSYLKSLAKGEVKINSSVLYPQDIISKIRGENYYGFSNKLSQLEKTQYNAMWKGLKDFGETGNTLVVVDVSGSMFTANGKGHIQAIDASIGLGLYFAERNTGIYKNKFITFSARPEFVDVSEYNNIVDRVQATSRVDCGCETNIEKVFNLILKSAIKSKTPQEEIPRVLIISDMEFDYCASNVNERLMTTMSENFAKAGYKLPKLAFWNVCSRTNTIPMKENELGVALISGYSPTSIKAVFSNEIDPYKALLECFYTARYDKVVELLKVN